MHLHKSLVLLHSNSSRRKGNVSYLVSQRWVASHTGARERKRRCSEMVSQNDLRVEFIVLSFQENGIALLQNNSLFVVNFILGTVGSCPLFVTGRNVCINRFLYVLHM